MSVVSLKSVIPLSCDVLGCFRGLLTSFFRLDEDSEREEIAEAREDAYYDGREDQAYEDDGGW